MHRLAGITIMISAGAIGIAITTAVKAGAWRRAPVFATAPPRRVAPT
jgi:hypothetical protein